mmetsp:Transcript_3327/g.4963  ORF Transcript_3327/g.4963 Transcript_3327/m.4963 type:complete len:139 (+) Transcript_3327:83-499(+)
MALGLRARLPNKIEAVKLAESDNTIICRATSFKSNCIPTGINVDYHQGKMTDMGKFSSLLNMKRVTGDGILYLAGHNILTRKLDSKMQTIRMPQDVWVAMTSGMTVQYAKDGRKIEIQGPGTVWYDTGFVRSVHDVQF